MLYRSVFTISLLFLVGCGAKFKVVDLSSNEIKLKKFELESFKKFLVYNGASQYTIKKKNVHKLQMNPNKSIIYNRKNYNLAEITLKDGSKQGSLSDTAQQKIYICVDEFLIGVSKQNNSYRMYMANILLLEKIKK